MSTPDTAPASAFAHYDYTPDTAPTTGDAPAARTTVLIVGDTYPHRERLRALGGRWNAVSRGWEVPVAMAPKALTYPGVYDAADPSGRGALAALVGRSCPAATRGATPATAMTATGAVGATATGGNATARTGPA